MLVWLKNASKTDVLTEGVGYLKGSCPSALYDIYQGRVNNMTSFEHLFNLKPYILTWKTGKLPKNIYYNNSTREFK